MEKINEKEIEQINGGVAAISAEAAIKDLSAVRSAEAAIKDLGVDAAIKDLGAVRSAEAAIKDLNRVRSLD